MSDDDNAFQAFIGGFSHAKPSLGPPRSVSITTTTTTTTKRRKIELADAATVPLTSIKAPKRAKSPPKKPQTITDRATKAFQALPTIDDSVSKFFTTESTTVAGPDRQKPKRKRAKKATSSKPPPPVLYSPEKALLQAESQQFLFATSSQLAVEDSPKLIKETVAAVEASEASFSAQLSTKLSLQPAEKHHWGSSRRDFNGGMLRDTSGLRRTAPAPKRPFGQPEKDEGGWTVLSSSSPPVAAPPRLPAPAEMPLQQKDSNARLPISVSPEKPVRKRGRPPKKQQQTSAESAFVDIDEISDPESPATPSPPRRRAIASPDSPPTLYLSPSRSLHTTTTTADALTATAQLKAQDGQWSPVSKQLFPLITNTLKAMPRSTDPVKPSWHQKILLYDPIVLEDITADLNDKGLRVSIRRRKTKAAAKKGKKTAKEGGKIVAKEGTGVAMAGEQSGEAGTESVDEPLQPWMVQKWCEENSVCCLWKEGLRGGVRTRY